jgi:hypothetical protein
MMLLALASFGTAGGCGDDDDDDDGAGGSGGRQNPEQTGALCTTPDDCYPKVADKTTIQGDVQCLDRVRDGYCTHTCQEDADCCAAAGECDTDIKQVCSPFESTNVTQCFLSCEDADLRPVDGGTAGDVNEQEYCQREASPDFICRSSGGGTENRKICVPGDCGVGASCVDATDCDADLECLTAFNGGYCGRQNCSVNADCPANARCVRHADGANYCFVSCVTEWDCSFCRGAALTTDCRTDATFAETGTTGSVCVPR